MFRTAVFEALESFASQARAGARLALLRITLPLRLKHSALDELLAALSASPSGARVDFRQLDSAIRTAERVLVHVPGLPNTCLYRSLARYALFRSGGWQVEFVMGVPRTSAEEQGHAWLELAGEALDEPEPGRFLESFRYPARTVARA